MAANISLSMPMQMAPEPAYSASKQASFSALPKAICTSIFTLLPPSDLAVTSCVNRSWRELAKDKCVWEHRLSQDVRDNFAPLINEGRLSWPEAYRYTSLSHFVSDTIVKRMTYAIRLQKNPTLSTEFLAPSIMPTPYIQYGKYTFTICDLTNIEIQEEGSPTFTLLPVEEGKSLTHLAVDGDILFALRKDGRIVRWNYKTKERLEDIHTDLETTRNSPKPRSCDHFYVKDGYIIMTSSAQSRDDPDRTRLEIIPYADPEKRQIINSNYLNDCDNDLRFSKIILKGNQMIGLKGKIIWIKNFSNHEVKIYRFTDLLYNMNLDLNTLYAVDTQYRIHKIDLKSGNLTKSFNSFACHEEIRSFLSGKITTIVNDLVFTSLPSKKVIIEDLQSGADEILLEDQSQEIHSPEIPNQEIHDVVAHKRNLLKKVIERVKSKRKPSSYPRLKKIFRSILKSHSVRFLRKFIIPIMLACIAIISLIRRVKFK